MVHGHCFPLASSSLCWYKSKQALNIDLHPCVQEAVRVTPPHKQNQSRVQAVKLQTRMWLNDKMNRIISLAAYNHFCNVLTTSSLLSFPGDDRLPTEAERELLLCTHIQSHDLLKQALGVCWNDKLIGTDFLLVHNVFDQEPNIGYNEAALATLQLRTMLNERKS